MKNKRKRRFTKQNNIGYLFVLPFIIGFIFLFMKPMISSLIYSLHEIKMSPDGFDMTYVGLENYRYALFGDAKFVKTLISVLSNTIFKICTMLFLSMFIAILLNQKFYGRVFFRVILFLPVIFSADQVMSMFSVSEGASQITEGENAFVSMTMGATGLVKELIYSFGAFSSVIERFTKYASGVFDLLWDIGIQIILFIIGLQAIPSHLYEVCEMEGATKWETFYLMELC